jgi:hypothetical protein
MFLKINKMIYAFTGKTGSGKTFNMVKLAYRDWLRGVDIYSNTILFFSNFGGTPGCTIEDEPGNFTIYEHLKYRVKKYYAKYIQKVQFTPLRRGNIIYFEDISEILDVQNGLILFDEAQVLFNARQWESLPAEFQYKLQQHRKHNLDLFCTTQNMGTIDITYRRLVHAWLHHEVIFSWGGVWLGLFAQKQKDVDQLYNTVDDLVVANIKIKHFWIWFRSRVLYDTLFDIGFKRFKKVWLHDFQMKKTKMMIIPKNMSLKNVQSAKYTLQSSLKPRKLTTSSRT